MKWSVIQRKLAKVDKAIDKAIASAEIPGAVVLARMPRDGERIEHCSVRGLASARPERLPMARETIFDLASLTKPIATTTATLLLASDGLIDLDQPVAKYIPTFAERDKDQVTVRHLLTHSSGLKPWRAFHELLIEKERKTGEKLLATDAGREFILERVLRSGLVHDPGDAAVYGDLDFIALGALVENATSERLDAFVKQRVTGPLGLTDTFFLPLGEENAISEPLRRRIAATENCAWREQILWGEVHDPNAWAMGGVAGHAGLFATADDVMTFAQTIVDVWQGRSDALPQEWVRKFAKRQQLPEKSDWALGWDTPTPGQSSSGQYFSEASIGHLGFTGTSLWIDLEAEAIVVMLTNRVHQIVKRSKFTLRATVHDLILEAFRAE